MLVSVCGSQGSGKSTVLQCLQDKGHNVIERKTSRSILTDWDVTLQQVNNNIELAKQFQKEITKRKVEDEYDAAQSDELWFTERTYIDLMTFTMINIGKDNDETDWITDYVKACAEYQQQYAGVFYLKAGHFNIESDGVRGANPLYSRMVDTIMLDYMQLYTMPSRLFLVETPQLDLRVEMIERFAKQL